MASTANRVLTFLEREPAIKRCLSQELINISALAKYISNHPDFELTDATIDGIITAIRRSIDDTNKSDKEYECNLKKIFKNSRVSSKNMISAVTLRKDESTFALLPEVFSAMNFYGGETLRLVKASKSIMLMFDEENLSKILNIYTMNKITQIRKNLGVVTIHLDQSAANIPGVFATILNELAINKINIIEAVTCQLEYMIFVNQDDLVKTYEILSNLCKNGMDEEK